MPTIKFRFRRDTAANWTSIDPTLALGEPGIETDTRRIKYGDGVTSWTSLPYSVGAVAWGGITGTLSAQTDLQAALDAKPAYSEGTWTPTMIGGSTAGTTTYVSQFGFYTRIGNMVFFDMTVAWSAATGTGEARYSLPFAAVNTANRVTVFEVRSSLAPGAGLVPKASAVFGASYIRLYSYDGATGVLTSLNVENASRTVRITGQYAV